MGNFRLVNGTDHVKGAFRILGKLIVEYPLTAVQSLFTRHHLARRARKLFGHEKRLGKESLQTPGAEHCALILAGKFGNSQHGDDVLEVFINRQRLAYFLSDLVMTFAGNVGHQHLGAGLEQVDGRIQPLTGALSGKSDGRGKVTEGVHGGRIGEIIRRDINRLNGRDGAGLGVADALFQFSQFRRQPSVDNRDAKAACPRSPETSMPA